MSYHHQLHHHRDLEPQPYFARHQLHPHHLPYEPRSMTPKLAPVTSSSSALPDVPKHLQVATSSGSTALSSNYNSTTKNMSRPETGGARLTESSSPASEADEGPGQMGTPSGKGSKQRKPRVVERGREACNECRHHKIRCHPHPNDPAHIHPCARCARMSLECVFKKHNRGRKRKQPIPEDSTENSGQRITGIGEDCRSVASRKPPPPPSSSSQDRLAPSSAPPPPKSDFETIQLPPLFSTPTANGKFTLPPPNSSSFFGSRVLRNPVIDLGKPSNSFVPNDASSTHPKSLGAAGENVGSARRTGSRTMSLWTMVQNEPDGDDDDDDDGDDYEGGLDRDELDDDDDDDDGMEGKRQRMDEVRGSMRFLETTPTSRPSSTTTAAAVASLASLKAGGNRDLQIPRPIKPKSSGGALIGDPVTAGILTPSESVALFDLFIKHFNNVVPVLDPFLHGHDYIRRSSPFLYTAIMAVTSRHMSFLTASTPAMTSPIIKRSDTPPESVTSAHQQILSMARDHLIWAFVDATSDIAVAKAIAILTMWKESDDDKTTFYFNRAVLLAKELGIGRIPSSVELMRMDSQEKRELRSRQRFWLTLFATNTVFHMQFRQPMLISHTDPLVSTAHDWLKMTDADFVLLDTQLVFSVTIRKRFLHYKELLMKPTESDADEVAPPSALSLSILSKTINTEWDVITDMGIRDIIDAGGTPGQVNEPRLLASSLRLNLNFLILNQTLRIPRTDRINNLLLPTPNEPPISNNLVQNLASMPAFHHCLNAATSVLMRMQALDKDQMTFAADTLLHFAIYAATFLWTLCRSPHLCNFDQAEVNYCRQLILKMADLLENASAYPTSPAALHGKCLRRFCRPNRHQQQQDQQHMNSQTHSQLQSSQLQLEADQMSGAPTSVESVIGHRVSTNSPSIQTGSGAMPVTTSMAFGVSEKGHGQFLSQPEKLVQHSPSSIGLGSKSSLSRPSEGPPTGGPGERVEPRGPSENGGIGGGSSGINGREVAVPGGSGEDAESGDGSSFHADSELDYILADFPWTGLDLPWSQLDLATV